MDNVPIVCVHKDGHDLVLQMQREFGVKRGGGVNTLKFSVYSHMVFIFSLTGNRLTVQHRPTAKQKHYGITVPLQLVGQDWKPISQLKSQVNNCSKLNKIFFALLVLLHICFSIFPKISRHY